MTKTFKASMAFAAIALSAAMFSSPSSAAGLGDLAGGDTVVIGGYVDMDTKAQNVRTTARGRNAKAGTSVGAIHNGTKILGYAKIKTDVKNVRTTARGRNAQACTQIGTIGDNPACSGKKGGALGGLLPF
jgi:hypothetical protein